MLLYLVVLGVRGGFRISSRKEYKAEYTQPFTVCWPQLGNQYMEQPNYI